MLYVIQKSILVLAVIVAIEFCAHIVYHALTGKAGLEDPPFEYLGDIYRKISSKIRKERP